MFQSHPQGDIWVSWPECWFTNQIGNLLETWQAGFIYYSENELDAIKEVLVNFQQKNDDKAVLIVSLAYSLDQVRSVSV
jgi:hypothetical protein